MKDRSVSFKTDSKTCDKLREISEAEVRSVSQQIIFFIREGIARWEAEHEEERKQNSKNPTGN